MGEPQGSCLGPLLFLIYINDLSQAVQDSSVTMYADDTSLCHQSNHLTQLNEAINSDRKKLEAWLHGNKISLNVAKTHSMLISFKQKGSSLRSRNEALELKIRETELEVVQKTKLSLRSTLVTCSAMFVLFSFSLPFGRRSFSLRMASSVIR